MKKPIKKKKIVKTAQMIEMEEINKDKRLLKMKKEDIRRKLMLLDLRLAEIKKKMIRIVFLDMYILNHRYY